MAACALMSDRPILFSGPMVRAILSGAKSQTRRVVKKQPWASCCIEDGMEGEPPFVYSALGGDGPGHDVHETRTPCRCPYGKPGDLLWVRETWAPLTKGYAYRADPIWNAPPADRWHPSIHMPRVASRITLEIIGVRVERLQDISVADAIAEGVVECNQNLRGLEPCMEWRYAYEDLWGQINGQGSWDANPWVWVVSFNAELTVRQIVREELAKATANAELKGGA